MQCRFFYFAARKRKIINNLFISSFSLTPFQRHPAYEVRDPQPFHWEEKKRVKRRKEKNRNKKGLKTEHVFPQAQ